MKAIKTLVVFMGVLLVAGLALLGYGMYSKAGRVVKPSATAQAPVTPGPVIASAPNSAAVAAFAPLALNQPAGSQIAATQWNGSLLAVTVTGGGPADRVVIVDLANAAVLGTVSLGAAAPVAAPVAQ